MSIPKDAQHTFAILAMMMIFWATEVTSHAITGLMGCYLFSALGVVPFATAFCGFVTATPVVHSHHVAARVAGLVVGIGAAPGVLDSLEDRRVLPSDSVQPDFPDDKARSEEHTSELQSPMY